MKKGIIGLLSAAAGAVAGAAVVGQTTTKAIGESMDLSQKHLSLFLLMNQWVKIKQEGKSLASYLKEKGYHKIAVYGMSYAGETLVSELADTEIDVVYGIDQNASNIYSDIDIYTLEDSLPEVDAIVVSAVYFFDIIEERLSKITDSPIISLEDILYEV